MRAKLYIHICYRPKGIEESHRESKSREKFLRVGIVEPKKGEVIGNIPMTSFKKIGTITLNAPDDFQCKYFKLWNDLKQYFIMTNGYEHYQRITLFQRDYPLDKKADQAPPTPRNNLSLF